MAAPPRRRWRRSLTCFRHQTSCCRPGSRGEHVRPMASETLYKWQLLRAGPLRLDGGSMFGVVPKAVWNRTVPCDEQGRIECAHNCLLLESLAPLAGAPKRLLIETGSGDKFDEKSRQIFGLGDYSIIDAMRDAGVSCDAIDHVIVSHLHFDHA